MTDATHGPERFTPLTKETMTEAQRAAAEAIVSGPRGGMRGPFKLLLRSPDLADKVQRVGEYIRFRSSIPRHLNEMAILICARAWTAQFEWYAHRELALEAGLDPAIADAIARNERPAEMDQDAAAVWRFCTELLTNRAVSDATFLATRDRFGETGIVDLIGALGYYSLVSMCLNVDRYPLPDGMTPPLAPL